MKFLKTGLSLAIVGVGLAIAPGSPSTAVGGAPQAAPDDSSLVQKMRSDASGNVRFSDERSTGKVSFVRAVGRTGDLLPTAEADSKADAVAKVESYLDKYVGAFGGTSAQLTRVKVSTSDVGTTVTYVQEYDGLPVYGAELRAHVSDDGRLTAVNGELVPVGSVTTTPELTEAQAAERAVALVKAQPPVSEDGQTHVEDVTAKSTVLEVYKQGLVQGLAKGEVGLVYQVEVTNGSTVRDMVFVNAITGKVVNRYSMMADALERELYEESTDTEPVFVEGDEFPGDLNEDQQNLVLSTGEIYWLYKNTFNRDSYTGEGTTMKTVNNDPRINCPNANWNGTTANYCDGVTSDDVVSHEWTHAYTEYTHGLIYQWQSGALNEGYSDIFGETLDLLNGREDEEEGDINAPRPVGLCAAASPANPVVTINAPSSIAKDCLAGTASYGPQVDGTGVTGDVVAPTDAVEEGGTATDGCSEYTSDVTGKIVMVDRGLCPFTDKTTVAQEAGAIAIIIGNRDDSAIYPSGDIPATIPTVTIGLTDRESIRTALTAGETVNVTLRDKSGERVDSYRWLIGEKSPAFGGAIRDMWNPTCYGDPGKVSDVEYKCSTDDNGGVHGNSGVVNHGYALLVDGGTFNDVSVTGIGFDKALNIYYRAMTEYQTPVSNFVDHADSLIASCTDLIDKKIMKVEIGGPGGSYDPQVSKRKIEQADCDQVEAMTEAVEFRLDPTEQCAWEPMFTEGEPTPVDCGEGFGDTTVFSEGFDSGVGAWELSAENPFDGPTADWTSASPQDYLGDHTGAVAYGPAPDRGVCDGSTNDFSSVDYMTSPSIAIPAGTSAPRLHFTHSVATEVGYDGGTVQIAVNGGDFVTVPADAYTFNGPGNIATEAEGNTNPLAGEDGFTGTDPNKSYSEWGTSEIDLGALAEPVGAGDAIEIRFAIGRDGCGGNEGWFVDDVQVIACAEMAATELTATHQPEPSVYGDESTVEVTVEGEDATGDVTLSLGDTEIGTAEVAEGAASIPVPALLPAGTHAMTVSYSGDDTYDAATADVTVTVEKAATTTKATAKPKQVKKGAKATVTVKVTSPGLKPAGKVQLKLAGKVIGTGKLVDGKVVVKTKALTKVGNTTMRVVYIGAPNYKASSTSVTVKVVK